MPSKKSRKRGFSGSSSGSGSSSSIAIHLEDPTPSAIFVNHDCRLVLWGLVERVAKTAEKEAALEEEQGHADADMVQMSKDFDLPLSFCGNANKAETKKKKRKREQEEQEEREQQEQQQLQQQQQHSKSWNKNKLYSAASSTPTAAGTVRLPLPTYLGRPVTHNVYMAKYGATDSEFYPALAIGVGPNSSIANPTCIVYYIGYGGEIAEVPRNKSCLREVEEDRYDEVLALLEQEPCDAPAPDDVHPKYWDQRYRLFSRFDQGVVLDNESWYSLTPEVIAQNIAYRCRNAFAASKNSSSSSSGGRSSSSSSDSIGVDDSNPLSLIMDCFAGSGGNAIQLATICGCKVLASDIDETKTEALKQNAAVYNVSSNLEALTADAYELLRALPIRTDFQRHEQEQGDDADEGGKKVAAAAVAAPSCSSKQNSATPDIILLAPPWGGPEYLSAREFDLRTMIPSGDGVELAQLAASRCAHICYVLPRNTPKADLVQLAKSVSMPFVIEDIYLKKKMKLTMLYLGERFVGKTREM